MVWHKISALRASSSPSPARVCNTPGRLQLELPAFPRVHLRAALPCTIAMDCNVAGAANPFGGPGLTCGTESLPDGGMCFDEAQCAQPAGSPA